MAASSSEEERQASTSSANTESTQDKHSLKNKQRIDAFLIRNVLKYPLLHFVRYEDEKPFIPVAQLTKIITIFSTMKLSKSKKLDYIDNESDIAAPNSLDVCGKISFRAYMQIRYKRFLEQYHYKNTHTLPTEEKKAYQLELETYLNFEMLIEQLELSVESSNVSTHGVDTELCAADNAFLAETVLPLYFVIHNPRHTNLTNLASYLHVLREAPLSKAKKLELLATPLDVYFTNDGKIYPISFGAMLALRFSALNKQYGHLPIKNYQSFCKTLSATIIDYIKFLSALAKIEGIDTVRQIEVNRMIDGVPVLTLNNFIDSLPVHFICLCLYHGLIPEKQYANINNRRDVRSTLCKFILEFEPTEAKKILVNCCLRPTDPLGRFFHYKKMFSNTMQPHAELAALKQEAETLGLTPSIIDRELVELYGDDESPTQTSDQWIELTSVSSNVF